MVWKVFIIVLNGDENEAGVTKAWEISGSGYKARKISGKQEVADFESIGNNHSLDLEMMQQSAAFLELTSFIKVCFSPLL